MVMKVEKSDGVNGITTASVTKVHFALVHRYKIDAADNYLSLDGILSLSHAEKLESEAT